MPRNTAVVVQKEIAELQVGDKLLTDIIGYKGKTLLHRGQTISVREHNWLKKQLGRTEPKLSSTRYLTNKKAVAAIKDKDGNVLVGPGKLVTEEALKPLLEEGFTLQETFESEVKMFYRPSKWPANEKWHIAVLNPTVQVETMMLVNDDGSPAVVLPAKKKEKETTTAGSK